MKLITEEVDYEMKTTGEWNVYHMTNMNTIAMDAMFYPSHRDSVVVDIDDDYTLVATINLKKQGIWLWRLTNNVEESWSNDFRGEHTTWDMEVHNQLDAIGHRSSMIGDIYHDVENDIHYMIIGVGHVRLQQLGEE